MPEESHKITCKQYMDGVEAIIRLEEEKARLQEKTIDSWEMVMSENFLRILENDPIQPLIDLENELRVRRNFLQDATLVWQVPESDKIGYGSRFTIKFLGADETETFSLVPEDPKSVDNEVSSKSSFGSSLLGKKKGCRFVYSLSGGKKVEGIVVDVDNFYSRLFPRDEKNPKAYLEQEVLNNRRTEKIGHRI